MIQIYWKTFEISSTNTTTLLKTSIRFVLKIVRVARNRRAISFKFENIKLINWRNCETRLFILIKTKQTSTIYSLTRISIYFIYFQSINFVHFIYLLIIIIKDFYVLFFCIFFFFYYEMSFASINQKKQKFAKRVKFRLVKIEHDFVFVEKKT